MGGGDSFRRPSVPSTNVFRSKAMTNYCELWYKATIKVSGAGREKLESDSIWVQGSSTCQLQPSATKTMFFGAESSDAKKMQATMQRRRLLMPNDEQCHFATDCRGPARENPRTLAASECRAGPAGKQHQRTYQILIRRIVLLVQFHNFCFCNDGVSRANF